MARIKLVVALLFAVFGLLLIAQNTTLVSARFLFWAPSLSLSVLLLIAVGIGFVLGLCGALMLAVNRKSKKP